ncbi:hypothetical protein UVI_02054610 [Ustilaginoidea virens]|uniref:Uncharacterized protein n=1 Tax=Ustilaginoidea virens TaxID=1159556 RepID=A0A1B5L4U8_USTVR|nr:hypothetical protein UVI_02054610 [Ustilaginoidea virens]
MLTGGALHAGQPRPGEPWSCRPLGPPQENTVVAPGRKKRLATGAIRLLEPRPVVEIGILQAEYVAPSVRGQKSAARAASAAPPAARNRFTCASSGYQRSRDGPAKARRRNAVLDAGSRHAGLDGVGDDLLSNLGPYPSCRSGAERQTEVARRATHGDASRRIASRVQLEGELLVLETMETNGGGEDP